MNKEETIYIISNNIEKDMKAFVGNFKRYFDKCDYYHHFIISKDNIKFQFTNNGQGLRYYRYYDELYDDFLKKQNKDLYQVLLDIKEYIGKKLAKENYLNFKDGFLYMSEEDMLYFDKEETEKLLNMINKVMEGEE